MCGIQLCNELNTGVHARIPVEHHHRFREPATGCHTARLSESKVSELVQEHWQQSLAQPLCVERQTRADAIAHPNLMYGWVVYAGIEQASILFYDRLVIKIRFR